VIANALPIHALVVPVIAFEVLMDAPTDVATLLGELGVGNDKAVAELVVLLYSELRSLASRYLRREPGAVPGRRGTTHAPYPG
jgi:hypothetical protein